MLGSLIFSLSFGFTSSKASECRVPGWIRGIGKGLVTIWDIYRLGMEHRFSEAWAADSEEHAKAGNRTFS